MTTLDESPVHFDDDGQIEAWVQEVFHPPTHRQLWAFFLDATGTLIGPLMPCDELPADPDDTALASDGDQRTASEAVADLFALIQTELGLAELVLVWEHTEGATLSLRERAWAGRVATQLVDRGGRLRAQLLLHRGGVRQLGPDDLV